MKTNDTTKPILIIGAGNIGSAMAKGIASPAFPVILYNRSPKRLEDFAQTSHTTVTSDLDHAIASKPWMILLCVETDAVATILRSHASALAKAGAIIGSCAAVPTIADIRTALGPKAKLPIVRILPNIAASCGHSVNLMASEGLSEKQFDTVTEALAGTGRSFSVPENLFGAAMSLSSCGIAMILRYVRAQAEAAVQLGLPPQVATQICAATIAGAAQMLSQGAHPEELIDRVTTPGGLTIRGLNAMEAAGFTHAVQTGVFAATK